MKNLSKIFSIVFLFCITHLSYGQTGQDFIHLYDNTGVTMPADINAEIEDTIDVIQEIIFEFEDFQVFDFGYYAHNSDMSGRVDQIFENAKSDIEGTTKNYFLLGREYSNGVLNKINVFLSLPILPDYPCVLESTLAEINSLLTTEGLSIPMGNLEEALQVELDIITELKEILYENYFCCPIGPQAKLSSPNSCSPYMTLDKLFKYVRKYANDQKVAYCRLCPNPLDGPPEDDSDIYTHKDGYFRCQILDIIGNTFVEDFIDDVEFESLYVSFDDFEQPDNYDLIGSDPFNDLIYYAKREVDGNNESTFSSLCFPTSGCYPGDDFCEQTYNIATYEQCLWDDLNTCTFINQSRAVVADGFTKQVSSNELMSEMTSLSTFMQDNGYNGVYYLFDEVLDKLYYTDKNGALIDVVDKQEELDRYNENNMSSGYNYGMWLHYNSDTGSLKMTSKAMESSLTPPPDAPASHPSNMELASHITTAANDLMLNYAEEPKSMTIAHNDEVEDHNDGVINDGSFEVIKASILKWGGLLYENGVYTANNYELMPNIWNDELEKQYNESLLKAPAPVAGISDAALDQVTEVLQLMDLGYTFIKSPVETIKPIYEGIKKMDSSTINAMVTSTMDKYNGNDGTTIQSYTITKSGTKVIIFVYTGGLNSIADIVTTGVQKFKNLKGLVKEFNESARQAIEGLSDLHKKDFFGDFGDAAHDFANWTSNHIEAWKELFSFPNMRTSTDWLNNVSEWLDNGIQLIADGAKIRIKNGVDEVGEIINDLLHLKYDGYGGDVITHPSKTTTAIGKYNPPGGTGTKDLINSGITKSGKNSSGVNVLNDVTDVQGWPPQKIWDEINQPWMDDAIARDDVIRAVSDPLDIGNVFSDVSDIPTSVFSSPQSLANYLKNLSDPDLVSQLSFYGREIRHLSQNDYLFDTASKLFSK